MTLLSDTARIRMHIAMETEGERSPIQAMPQEMPLEHIEAVERLCAADLVMAMRRVKQNRWDELTRERMAKQFEAVGLQFSAAACWLRRFRADDSLPGWLREGG